MPVALREPALGALVAAGADHLGGFGFHQLLEDEADEVTDEIDTVAATERLEQRGHVRLGQERLGRRHLLAFGESSSLPRPQSHGRGGGRSGSSRLGD